jgi:hypothetical protein
MVRRIPIVFTLVLFASGVSGGQSETEYFAVFLDGQKTGHAIHQRTVEADKVTTTETMALTLNRGGVLLPVKMVETSVESTTGRPISFESVQQLGALSITIQGRLDPNGVVELTISSAAGVEKSRLAWPVGALMSEGLRLLQHQKGLAEGTELTTKIFSPATVSAFDARVRVGATRNVDLLGRVVSLTEVTTVISGPGGQLTSSSFIDEKLDAQKSIVPVGDVMVELVACPKEFALSDDQPIDLLAKLTVACPVSLAQAASAKSITYYLSPTGTGTLQIPSTDSQTVAPDGKGGLVVTVRPAAAGQAAFPYRGQDGRAVAALRPSRFIQSGNPQVIELARQAVGETKDVSEAVRRVEKFVSQHIEEKSLSVGYASAAEVAVSRQGDCSEHAVLAAAMCRAVGIPAEVVAGVIYVENYAGRQQVFVPHAWAQAYVGGKWVGLDATGRPPRGTTCTHIALGAGDGSPEDFFGIVTRLGSFRIDKVVLSN